jgi:predicted nuclease of predicted toxin-antitoxin system
LSERVRFHLDEHVDPDVALALRRYGIDVTTTVEAGLRTRNDLDQIDFARGSGRVIVTHDVDFLRFASQSVNHPGMAYCALGARSIGEIIRSLILIYEVLEPAELSGRVEYL